VPTVSVIVPIYNSVEHLAASSSRSLLRFLTRRK